MMDRPDRPDRSDLSDLSDLSDKSDLSDQSDRSDRSDNNHPLISLLLHSHLADSTSRQPEFVLPLQTAQYPSA